MTAMCKLAWLASCALLALACSGGTAESTTSSGGSATSGGNASGASSGTSGGASSSGGFGDGGEGLAANGGNGAVGGTPFPDDLPPEQLPRFVHYIRGTTYTKLVFEVDAVPGFELRADAEARLVERFEVLLDKPHGIELLHDDALEAVGDDHAWTDAELDTLAGETFDGDPAADTIAIHVMVVDGHSASDGDAGLILGLAWNHLNVTIFKSTIESTCGGLALVGALREQACAEAELGILTHEVGHVIGLVDNGLPMVTGHRDPDEEHGAHDENQDCIMFWAYEGEALVDLIEARVLANQDDSLVFDAECLADIDAVK
jgi:hypothetical protein